MPRLAAWAVRTPWGDADATTAALVTGGGPARPLGNDLVGDLLALAREVLAGARPDLVLFASTKADLPRWCDDVLATEPTGAGGPAAVARALGTALGAPALAVSAACASGTAALGIAARRIVHGGARRVLVLAGDRLAPFVEEGFAALRALDPLGCRPFAADRAGLVLGETRAAVLLDDAAGGTRLAGWGARLDANHLTGPDRAGAGLAAAVRAALACAGLPAPAAVFAHGTGTRYNDDAESLAYHAACPGAAITATKGLLGHSLGACGLTDAALAATALVRGRVPGLAATPTAGCAAPLRLLPRGDHALDGDGIVVANAGFGGIDFAVVVARREPDRRAIPVAPTVRAQARLTSTGWSVRRDGGEESGGWQEPGIDGALPRLGAPEVLGRVDTGWGRMDPSCRALVALGRRLAPPEDAVLLLATERGCAASDRLFETARRAGSADAQRFPYTLPTAPIGEASIRLGVRGGGLALLGVDDALVDALAADWLADGSPAALVARIDADRPPHTAHARLMARS